MKNRQKTTTAQNERTGNAIVELVIGLPILMLLTFGSIEVCNLNHLKQVATETSYQGALTGMTLSSSEAQVTNLMTAMLTAQSINGVTISITGVDGTTPFDSVPSGDPFVVTTIIDGTQNLAMIPTFVDVGAVRADKYAIKP